MKSNLSDFFDDSGQMTEKAKLFYLEAVRQRRLDEVPDELYQYIHTHQAVLKQCIEAYENTTPILVVHPKKNPYLSPKKLIAAACFLTLSISTLSYFFLNNTPDKPAFSNEMTKDSKQNTSEPFTHQDKIDNANDEIMILSQPSMNQVVVDSIPLAAMVKIMQTHPEDFVFDQTDQGGLMNASSEQKKGEIQLVSDSVLINSFQLVWRINSSHTSITTLILSKDHQQIGELSKIRELKIKDGLIRLSLPPEEQKKLTSGGYYIALYPSGSVPYYQRIWYYNIK